MLCYLYRQVKEIFRLQTFLIVIEHFYKMVLWKNTHQYSSLLAHTCILFFRVCSHLFPFFYFYSHLPLPTASPPPSPCPGTAFLYKSFRYFCFSHTYFLFFCFLLTLAPSVNLSVDTFPDKRGQLTFPIFLYKKSFNTAEKRNSPLPSFLSGGSMQMSRIKQ